MRHERTAAFDSAKDRPDRLRYTDVMQQHLRITRRTRLRLTLLAVLALLCQQVASAAYVCPVLAMPATDTAMSADCNGMPVAESTADTQTATLCVLHCAQHATVTNNAQLPSVPPLLLPALLPAPVSIVTLPTTRTALVRNTAQRPPGLPPPLRFRVLLI